MYLNQITMSFLNDYTNDENERIVFLLPVIQIFVDKMNNSLVPK